MAGVSRVFFSFRIFLNLKNISSSVRASPRLFSILLTQVGLIKPPAGPREINSNQSSSQPKKEVSTFLGKTLIFCVRTSACPCLPSSTVVPTSVGGQQARGPQAFRRHGASATSGLELDPSSNPNACRLTHKKAQNQLGSEKEPSIAPVTGAAHQGMVVR